MQATALITDKDMHFSLQPVLLPDLQADDVLVKTAYSGVSIGTEFALIRNKISWGPFPICTGYMATGIVEAIGKQVTEVKPGDKVFVRRNTPFTLADGTAVSTVQGTHCSHIVTPVGGTHGLGILPEGAPMEAASMFVMPAVGFKGVDMAAPKLGQTVVVYGSGLIGLGVVAAASLRGCKVIAIDMQEKQLEMAKAFGADVLIHAATKVPTPCLNAPASPRWWTKLWHCASSKASSSGKATMVLPPSRSHFSSRMVSVCKHSSPVMMVTSPAVMRSSNT
jgi:2-desacetyl-2-hydroxyethyl bacteriochlorophyllide A dehydrogenase